MDVKILIQSLNIAGYDNKACDLTTCQIKKNVLCNISLYAVGFWRP